MALSPKTIRILGALVLSLVFIGAGYYFSSPFRTSVASATSTEELLKAYAVKDTDADGLPDWQESLYGTDASNAHSVDPLLTDKEAVDQGNIEPKFKTKTPPRLHKAIDADLEASAAKPNSLTNEFSKSFFQSFMESGATGSDETKDATLLLSLQDEFNRRVAEKIKSSYVLSSVLISPDVSASTYAGALEQAFIGNPIPYDASNPALLINAYISNNDTSAKEKLVMLGNIYTKLAADFAKIPTPPQFATNHLLLLQSTDLVGKSMHTVADYHTDPLATIGALGIYNSASENIIRALEPVADALRANRLPGAPGARILDAVDRAPSL